MHLLLLFFIRILVRNGFWSRLLDFWSSYNKMLYATSTTSSSSDARWWDKCAHCRVAYWILTQTESRHSSLWSGRFYKWSGSSWFWYKLSVLFRLLLLLANPILIYTRLQLMHDYDARAIVLLRIFCGRNCKVGISSFVCP